MVALAISRWLAFAEGTTSQHTLRCWGIFGEQVLVVVVVVVHRCWVTK